MKKIAFIFMILFVFVTLQNSASNYFDINIQMIEYEFSAIENIEITESQAMTEVNNSIVGIPQNIFTLFLGPSANFNVLKTKDLSNGQIVAIAVGSAIVVGVLIYIIVSSNSTADTPQSDCTKPCSDALAESLSSACSNSCSNSSGSCGNPIYIFKEIISTSFYL